MTKKKDVKYTCKTKPIKNYHSTLFLNKEEITEKEKIRKKRRPLF
jgi:hypothetical protein